MQSSFLGYRYDLDKTIVQLFSYLEKEDNQLIILIHFKSDEMEFSSFRGMTRIENNIYLEGLGDFAVSAP